MPTHRRLRLFAPLFALLFALLLPLAAAAQDGGLEIDIIGGNASALPIAVVPFAGSAGETDVAAVIRADLERSGQFRSLPVSQMPEQPSTSAELNYPSWRALQQQYVVIGRVQSAGGGQYRVEYELFDAARQERLLGFAMTARGSAMRDVAHQIADAVYEKILGQRGAFWTRMAYISSSGLGESARWSLVVADSDGHNAHTLLTRDTPLMSPAWSPDGSRIAYVSFEEGNSAIYIHNISTGAREKVAGFRGINSAPTFSPDGRRLAMTLSRSGNPEIYVMDLASRALTQITHQLGIDTEPEFSADGQWVYFTSDRSGGPQIYRAPASGGGASRVTFQGNYNASVSVSADGQKLAVAQGGGNNFRIAIMDSSLGSARWSTLSPGSLDESPSFAPNGAMVLYAAREGGRGVLYSVSSDGRVRQRLVVANADVREPAWGPFRQQR